MEWGYYKILELAMEWRFLGMWFLFLQRLFKNQVSGWLKTKMPSENLFKRHFI